MYVISSKDNEQIKHIKKLKDKKYRDEVNEYIVEGIKLVNEAIEENVNIKTIVVCEECEYTEGIEQALLYEIAKYNCMYVTKKIFLSITDVVNPQGILAVVEKEDSIEKINYKEDIILALDGIQDPGNLGTILRTADSANLKQIILSSDCADPYNPKVVRSTMGAIFRMNIITSENLAKTLQMVKKHKFEVVVTALDTNKSMYDIQYNKKVIVIGNEAKGVSNEIQNLADQKVIIPMLGKTESLNASVAASIMIYEYVRSKLKIWFFVIWNKAIIKIKAQNKRKYKNGFKRGKIYGKSMV